jgi:hypothetical protein
MANWLTSAVVVIIALGLIVSLVFKEIRIRHAGAPWYFAGVLIGALTSFEQVRRSALLVACGLALAVLFLLLGQRAERRTSRDRYGS